MTYNAEQTPAAGQWLALYEQERIALVETWHRRAGIRLARARLHATVHTVVENQIAMDVSEVVETLERLRDEGLSRHEAVHAVGSVLMEQIRRSQVTVEALPG